MQWNESSASARSLVHHGASYLLNFCKVLVLFGPADRWSHDALVKTYLCHWLVDLLLEMHHGYCFVNMCDGVFCRWKIKLVSDNGVWTDLITWHYLLRAPDPPTVPRCDEITPMDVCFSQDIDACVWVDTKTATCVQCNSQRRCYNSLLTACRRDVHVERFVAVDYSATISIILK